VTTKGASAFFLFVLAMDCLLSVSGDVRPDKTVLGFKKLSEAC